MVKDREQAILEAVRKAKKSQFGVTAIKVELEANLYRNWTEEECHNYMMEALENLGLAKRTNDEFWLSHEEFATPYEPRGALKYAEFYNDGSVDSEFTFTISLEHERDIFLLPKVINIWNDMCAEAGDTVDVDGAGMHMAFLNSRGGTYPTYCDDSHHVRFGNFKQSMMLLMPALYFLGSPDGRSRGLDYRRPGVGVESHRTAIDWRNGALEFRLFDTCYDNPDQVLDNLVVMSKCLRYWSQKRKDPGLGKITQQIRFGNSHSDELGRFYVSTTHMDLLNKGLRLLKPEYLTIGQVKAQRGFKTTKATLKGATKRLAKQATQEYKEYEERLEWRVKAERANAMSSLFTDLANGRSYPVDEIEVRADKYAQEFRERTYQPLTTYIKNRLAEYERSIQGDFILGV